MKDREGDPFFTWKDYLFGNNLGAFTLRMFIGIGATGFICVAVANLVL